MKTIKIIIYQIKYGWSSFGKSWHNICTVNENYLIYITDFHSIKTNILIDFSASGLLKRDVFKSEDKPIWYEIYALHPPFEEPRYDRPAPEIEVREIFYPEDNIRA